MHLRLSAVTLAILAVPSAPALRAESRNPADYPLRIHIFRRSETTFYHQRVAEEAKGDGRANLFEGGEPKGLDFEFECSEKLKTSSGYETFPAKWKKQNEELVILQPEFGKANSYSTCKLKVQMKDFAYVTHNGTLNMEPSTAFKQWMTAHDYDPEHGKDTPTPNKPATTAVAPAAASPAAGTPPAAAGSAAPPPPAAAPQL